MINYNIIIITNYYQIENGQGFLLSYINIYLLYNKVVFQAVDIKCLITNLYYKDNFFQSALKKVYIFLETRCTASKRGLIHSLCLAVPKSNSFYLLVLYLNRKYLAIRYIS